MPGLIYGYSYDVFISYRQKDNRHDGWVTEFVDNLKGELESTFKEEISVYFDINPHDGLHETYDVDDSLRDKLKCLIFIPVVSRTYCDPNSFAWEHELKAFIRRASADEYGLKVKLPNGNVAGRVLPVRIHDLEPTDIKLFEDATGSVMRTLDFVFRTASGVNRPLRAREDHPGDNLNKTYYQDQINKVALAIKEIIHGMKNEPVKPSDRKTRSEIIFDETAKEQRKQEPERTGTSVRRKLFLTILVAAALVVTGILLFPKILRTGRLDRLRASGDRITVAVMPFQNMTSDTTWNLWQDGIQDILIASLSNSEELKVRQAETVSDLVRGQGIVSYASITPSVASSISKKLDAGVMVYGSIKQAGSTARLYAQLIDTETEEAYKSFQIEGLDSEETIFRMIDSLSVMVRDFLILSKLKKTLPSYYQNLVTTNSPEAYRYFVQGRNLYARSDFLSAINWFSKAIAIDSNFYQALITTSVAYFNQYEIEKAFSTTYDKLYLYEEAKKWCLRAHEKIDRMPVQLRINANWTYANCFGTPYDRMKFLQQLIETDEMQPTALFNIGNAYGDLRQYEKAIPYYKQALEIYDKWGIEPFWVLNYNYLGQAYLRNGQYRKAARVFNKAEKFFPDDVELLGWQGILAAVRGDSVSSSRYYEKFELAARAMNVPEAAIASLRGFAGREAGLPDNAERYYRKALSLEPDNPDRINDLAFFLIDTDRNTEEGLDLAEKALEMVPGYFAYMDTNGWGLYKEGKFIDALEMLQNSWSLRLEKAVYDHPAFLRLEAARKAAAGQDDQDSRMKNGKTTSK